MGSGGQAIFPMFSFMSHSCVPNCAHSVFPNKTLALQAKHKIKAGEEFTIAYISPLQGSLKRRMKLHDKWFFDCGCPRCLSPTELDSFTSVHLCQVLHCYGDPLHTTDHTPPSSLYSLHHSINPPLPTSIRT